MVNDADFTLNEKNSDLAQAKEAILSIEWLPSPSSILTDILRVLDEDEMGAEALEERLKREPSVTAQVLKVANSAYYGCQRKIDSVGRAIVVIGMSEVRNICLTIALLQQFEKRPAAELFVPQLFWKHSLLTGFIASELAKDTGIISKDVAYTLGLIHDLGRLIMAYYLPDYFDKVVSLANTPSLLYQTERGFSVTHTDLGYWLATKWKLPETANMVMRYHHGPLEAETFKRESALIAVANLLANSIEGDSGENELPEQDVIDLLDMGFNEYTDYLALVTDLSKKVKNMLHILG